MEKGSFLEKLEKEALTLIESGNQLAYLSRQNGVFILFKETEQDPMKVAYICSSCGHSENSELTLERPYTLNCSKCGNLIFKQEKVKSKKKR